MCLGDIATPERLAAKHPQFPQGVDGVFGRRWRTNANQTCNVASVAWVPGAWPRPWPGEAPSPTAHRAAPHRAALPPEHGRHAQDFCPDSDR